MSRVLPCPDNTPRRFDTPARESIMSTMRIGSLLCSILVATCLATRIIAPDYIDYTRDSLLKAWQPLKGVTAVRATTGPGFAKAEKLAPGLESRVQDRLTKGLKLAGFQVTNSPACPAAVDVQLDCESTTAGLLYDIRLVFRQAALVPPFEAVLAGGTSAVIPPEELAGAVRSAVEVGIDDLAGLRRLVNAPPPPVDTQPTTSLDDLLCPRRHSMAPTIKLILEMDAQRRREELKRLFAPRLPVTSSHCEPVRLFRFRWYDYGDAHAVPARDVADFGWDRALEHAPGVIVR